MEKAIMFMCGIIEKQLPQAAIPPPHIFGPLGLAIRCHPLAHHLLLAFVNNEGLQTFEPITLDAAADTYNEVWTHYTRYLPAKLMSAYLIKRIMPREALINVNSLCSIKGNDHAEYKVVIDWLCVACMEDGKWLPHTL
jgi:hypothetical protein